MFKQFIFITCAFLLNTVAFAQTPKQSELFRISIKHQNVDVIIKSNRTTGFGWVLRGYDHNLLKLTGYHYIPPNVKKGIVGAPGNDEFTFTIRPSFLLAPQVSKISLAYIRPWEVDNNSMKHAQHFSAWVVSSANI